MLSFIGFPSPHAPTPIGRGPLPPGLMKGFPPQSHPLKQVRSLYETIPLTCWSRRPAHAIIFRMSEKIKVAINGYGNLGRGTELALNASPDMEVVAVFTRRDPSTVHTQGAPVYSLSQMADFQGKIDVVANCGGSATDLIEQGPAATKLFNTVDTFDTHAKIPEHFASLNRVAKENGHVAVLSVGWDPGLFSLARVYAESALSDGSTYTFWGKGVSQGHSDALRRIPGVADAVQYTVPIEATRAGIEAGEISGELPARQMHTRECFVVLEPGADAAAIEQEIVSMPNYFDAYDTTVNFISAEEMAANHRGMPHGGSVIRRGHTSPGVGHTVSFNLQLDSNPEFTGSVVAAYVRAAARLAASGQTGAFTAFDIAPALLSPRTPEELRAHLL